MTLRKLTILGALSTAVACFPHTENAASLNASVSLPAGLKRLPAVDGDVALMVTTGPKGGMKVTTVNPVDGLGDQTKESIREFCSALTFAGETGWAPLTYGEANTLLALKLKLVPGYLSDLWISSTPGSYHMYYVGKDDIVSSSDLISSARSAPAGVVCAKDAGTAPVFPPPSDVITCKESVNNSVKHIVQLVVRQDEGELTAKATAQKATVSFDEGPNSVLVPEGQPTKTRMTCEKIDDPGEFSSNFHSYWRDILSCKPEQVGGSGLRAKALTLTYLVKPMSHSTGVTRGVEGKLSLKGVSSSVELWCDMDLELLDHWND